MMTFRGEQPRDTLSVSQMWPTLQWKIKGIKSEAEHSSRVGKQKKIHCERALVAPMVQVAPHPHPNYVPGSWRSKKRINWVEMTQLVIGQSSEPVALDPLY